MTHSTPVDVGTRGASGFSGPSLAQFPLTLPKLIALSAWCGLVAGLLEVAAIILRRQFFDADQILRISHHFVWLIPVGNLCVFVALAVIGSVLVLIRPHRGRWLFVRLLTAFTIFPALLAAFPKIYSGALLLIAAGIAVRVFPIIERNRSRFRPFLLAGYAVPFAIVAILGGSIWYGDHSKQVAEKPGSSRRPARRTFSCWCSTLSPQVTRALTDTTVPRRTP